MKVLLVADTIARLPSQLLLCKELVKVNGDIDFTFVTDSNECEPLLEKSGFRFEVMTPLRTEESVGVIEPTNTKGAVGYKTILKISFVTYVISKFIVSLTQLLRYYRFAKKMILKYCPDIIIVNGDRGGFLEQAFLKSGITFKITTVIPYYVSSICPQYRNLIFSRIGHRFLERYQSNIVPRLLAKLLKNNSLIVDDKIYFYYDPGIALALKFFGSLSKWPWQIGCGLVKHICVDNYMTRRIYINNGVPEKKITVVGEVVNDILFANLNNKSELKAKLILKYLGKPDSYQKIIVCAVPQMAEHKLLSWKDHWRDVNYLVEKLTATQESVFLSLHPKMKRKNYEVLAREYGCHILDEPLHDILPLADLFVATFSSTVFWAPFCHVKNNCS